MLVVKLHTYKFFKRYCTGGEDHVSEIAFLIFLGEGFSLFNLTHFLPGITLKHNLIVICLSSSICINNAWIFR
jgi:hypothetical protein